MADPAAAAPKAPLTKPEFDALIASDPNAKINDAKGEQVIPTPTEFEEGKYFAPAAEGSGEGGGKGNVVSTPPDNGDLTEKAVGIVLKETLPGDIPGQVNRLETIIADLKSKSGKSGLPADGDDAGNAAVVANGETPAAAQTPAPAPGTAPGTAAADDTAAAADVAQDGDEAQAQNEAQSQDVAAAAGGGRRRTKRKGRKGSKKSKKGAKKSKKSSKSNQSQNGGRRSRKNRRKHSHRHKH
jgi:hypothetical protein